MPAGMVHVSYPFVTFHPTKPPIFPEIWQQGFSYEMTLRLLGLLPIGWHTIYVARVDEQKKEIENHDQGPMIKSWRHVLSARETASGGTLYTDALEVEAGIFNPLFWLYLQMYYRFRHWRWRKIRQ